MFDSISNFHHNLPWLVRVIIDFTLIYIVLRGVVARDITTFLEDKGVIRERKKSLVYFMLDFIYSKLAQIYFIARKIAIIRHFRLGHVEGNITTCTEGKCAIL